MTSTLAEGGFDSMLHGCPRSYMRTEASVRTILTPHCSQMLTNVSTQVQL